ncbi:MAG: ATP-binding protein, partial [Bacteroidetes bacterium]
VKLFMELHRGSIEVANISHKGATVRFRFPV